MPDIEKNTVPGDQNPENKTPEYKPPKNKPPENKDPDNKDSESRSTKNKSQNDKAAPEKEPFDLKAEILSWVQIIVCAVAIALFLNSFIIANSRVPSASMETTIMTGDRVIGSRLTYKFFDDPERGDIIIFRWPDNEKILFVKRIIGVPGDTVEIRDGRVYLNGSETPLEETYIREPMEPEPFTMQFTVPEDAYFCMGDNRNESMDARYWRNTYVYRDKIIAKVCFRYWPGFKLIK